MSEPSSRREGVKKVTGVAGWTIRRALELFCMMAVAVMLLAAAWHLLGVDENDAWCETPIGFLLSKCNLLVKEVVECCKNVAGVCVDTCANLVDTCKEFLVGGEPSCGSEPPKQ